MPPTPKIVTRTLSALPPRHYGTSAKTHYASLSPEEKKANIDREDVEFKQVQAFPHERNPPFCNEFTERDWKIFEKSSKEYYEIQGGKQCIMARVLPGAIACIEHILGAQLGHQVNFLFDYTEEEQIAFMYSHFRTNLSFDKLSDDVEKVRMTCKEFSMVAFDSYGGKFNTLTNVTYKEVWLKTPLKTQAKLYLKGISPIHLSITMAAKLEQEDYTNIYAAYSIITAAAKLEVERIIGNDRVKSTTSDKVPFNPTKAPTIQSRSFRQRHLMKTTLPRMQSKSTLLKMENLPVPIVNPEAWMKFVSIILQIIVDLHAQIRNVLATHLIYSLIMAIFSVRKVLPQPYQRKRLCF